MAERLNTSNSGSGAPGFKPCPLQFSLDKELYSTLSLFTQVYKRVPATYRWGGGTRTGWSSNTPSPGGTPLQEANRDVSLDGGRIFTTGVTIMGSHFQ